MTAATAAAATMTTATAAMTYISVGGAALEPIVREKIEKGQKGEVVALAFGFYFRRLITIATTTTTITTTMTATSM